MGMGFHSSDPDRHRSSDPSCTCGCHDRVRVVEHHKETIREVPKPVPLPTQDLTRFEIVKREDFGSFSLVVVKYPDATQNYNGHKIMVYRTKELDDAIARGRVDPHFLEWYPSPIARFPGSNGGYVLARTFMDKCLGER